MTRAKEELYLCHARMREFRGNTMYAVPSMFLEELPKTRADHRPVGERRGVQAAIEHWRGGGTAAQQGWNDAGVRPRTAPIPPRQPAKDDGQRLCARACWCATRNYGRAASSKSAATAVMRKVKIRFAHGGRTHVHRRQGDVGDRAEELRKTGHGLEIKRCYRKWAVTRIYPEGVTQHSQG